MLVFPAKASHALLPWSLQYRHQDYFAGDPALALCGLNLAWLFLAWYTGPDARAIIRDSALPSLPDGGITGEFVFLVIAIVGTTIAPWQLFFSRAVSPTSACVLPTCAQRVSTLCSAPSPFSCSPSA